MITRFLVAALFAQSSWAQDQTVRYQLGTVTVSERGEVISVMAQRPLRLALLNGNHTWPRLALDEDGFIRVGTSVINPLDGQIRSSTGNLAPESLALPFGVTVSPTRQGYQITRDSSTCELSQRALGLAGDKSALEALQYRNIQFAASKQAVVALVKRLADDVRDNSYRVGTIDFSRCRFTPTSLGNPDLLVELNRSKKGGWWITGSIEGTLLRSSDGRRWHPIRLPQDLSSLISSYIVNDKEIWLAAILGESEDDDPLLVYSGDGGKNFAAVRKCDALLQRVPKGWLEGQRRLTVSVSKTGAEAVPPP